MNKIIQKGLVLLVFLVPLVFSHATTEVYGLIKWTVLELGVLVLLVLWLAGFRESPLRAAGKAAFRGESLNLAVLAFFAVALLSLIKAGNKYEGVMSIYQLGAGMGLFFLVVNNVKEEKEVNQIVLAMVSSGVAACLFCLSETRGIKFNISRLAYTSTFGNPIFFAQYLSFVIPISAAMCFQKKQGSLQRIFFGFSALFMLIFVILARSRGAYLGLSAAFLCGYIVLLLHCPKKLKTILSWILAICLFAAALGVGFSVSERHRLRNLMRVYLWGSTLEMVKDNPLLGVGTGNFKVIYPLYRSAEEREVTPKGVTYSKAHNDFLQIWAETGTLGLVCFLWILFALFFKRRESPLRPAIGGARGESLAPYGAGQALIDGPSAHISLGLSLGLIALLFQALFNPALYVPVSAMGFWMLAGLFALRLK